MSIVEAREPIESIVLIDVGEMSLRDLHYEGSVTLGGHDRSINSGDAGMKGIGESLCSKVRLTLSAKNLKDCDVFSKSDPMCVVLISSGALRGGRYSECGRTETLSNCLNAEWSRTVVVDYFFEEVQDIRFEVYDIDSSSNNLADHDFIGSAESTLAEIVGGPFCRRSFSLRGKNGERDRGELTVVAEEAEDQSRETVVFALRALKLDKKQFFGRSDPFLQIYRTNDDGSSQLVHRTEVIPRSLHPEWKPFEVPMQQLCGSNRNRNIRFDCYSYGSGTTKNGNFIGGCEIAFNKLVGKNDMELPLINEKKRKKKGSKYVDSGRLVFMSVATRRSYSFLEFIAGGTQLDFSVAIDMTASNGCVTEPSSLHFIGGARPNEYHLAIRAVADICQHYNYSKTFDAMGFGAKIPPKNFVNHCFPLNVGSNSFAVFGVAGLLEAYQRCLMSCILYGPTNFAPIISEASKKAASYPRDGSRYQILLIITDGCISDFDQTLSAVIAASYLPLSIIIVGVGAENFDRMNELDADDGLLTYQGRKAQRDIVQFVPLRQFLNKKGMASSSTEGMLASAQLAKEVLAEIPDQLTSYMNLNGIKPRPSTDPFPPPPPPPQSLLPAAPDGSRSPGWVVAPSSQGIGFAAGLTQPYTTTPATYFNPATIPSSCGSQMSSGYGFNIISPQLPPVAQIPTSLTAAAYPASGTWSSVPSHGSIPSGESSIGFMVAPSSTGLGKPEPPPPYRALGDGNAFSQRGTEDTVGGTGRIQPSAPPPP
uniref:C2 domain-containing protein n=1 Tax=Parascaris univalens TaxID=6257 RepID=A0A915C0C5_PARUN